MKNTIAGIDLAKSVIQVCICKNSKVHSNAEMPHHEFLAWLFKSQSMSIIPTHHAQKNPKVFITPCIRVEVTISPLAAWLTLVSYRLQS